MLTRRRFLAACSAAALGLASWPLRAEWLWHACGPAKLPESLMQDGLMQRVWQGINPAQLWDCHAHLLGSGDSGSGCWLNPRMVSLWYPIERLQKEFYLNAACVSDQPGMEIRPMSHCASLGKGIDLDRGPDGPAVSNFRLFTRLMGEPSYERNLYGDLAAVGQLLRAGKPLRQLNERRAWQARLLYGSDYPLPGVLPTFSPRGLAADGFLRQEEAVFVKELRRYNPLLFDFALKRLLAVEGQGFDTVVFASRRIFTGDS